MLDVLQDENDMEEDASLHTSLRLENSFAICVARNTTKSFCSPIMVSQSPMK